jgi:hypothetical protein
MACVVTNLPIHYGDPVVAFKVLPIEGKYGRGTPGDSLTASHYIVSFPIEGTYGDYGHIEAADKTYGQKHPDEGEPDESLYMIMHRFAYETLAKTMKRRRAEWKAMWADNKPDWMVQEEADIEEILQEQEARAADPSSYEPKWRVNCRGAEMMFHSPEGEYPHTKFWKTAFHAHPQPRLFYEAYNETVGWMSGARYMFNFDIRPSLYAGQDTEEEGLKELHEACLKWLKEAYED